MAENEDIEKILYMGVGRSGIDNENSKIAKALNELMQYRAIGTVEELKSMKENGAFTGVELAQLAAMQMRLKEYSAIGTIEEFKALKEKSVAKKPLAHDDCENYLIRCTCGKCTDTRFFHGFCTWCGQALET